MITLRRITKDEVKEFWRLRLEALRSDPGSFAASYEESVQQSIDSVKDRIGETDDNYIIGVYDAENTLVGMAGFRREQALKLKHKGLIWGVYVSSTHRNQGIGKLMLSEIISRSKQLNDFKQILLCVTTTNDSGRRLYQSLGFITYGVEKNALRVGDQYLDEELMALTFDE
ncbi:GNAT family N-acetyltransferase [Cohnella luojiensis]|uniref:GNAT family N-acetyltransferase n=1 Tax=Cohnella luojiensis TaxID=652876 RepID=A0A4Y8LNM7_9BACL|nr:GNAT family N-acetyltransferase [Cohnella luojiensis]TFE22577.1 GNAT family N-acetyltransferase [Cohnella luojiensis]